MLHRQLLQAKTAKNDVSLHRFLYRCALHHAQKHQQPLSWLQFARASTHGYEFLPGQDYKWAILESIAKTAKNKFPSLRTGEICDLLAYLVNTQVKDVLYSSCQQCKGYCSAQRCYCKQLLIEIVGDSRHLLRHPEYMPLSDIKNSSWTAKNLITSHIVAIKRQPAGEYYHYCFAISSVS